MAMAAPISHQERMAPSLHLPGQRPNLVGRAGAARQGVHHHHGQQALGDGQRNLGDGVDAAELERRADECPSAGSG